MRAQKQHGDSVEAQFEARWQCLALLIACLQLPAPLQPLVCDVQLKSVTQEKEARARETEVRREHLFYREKGFCALLVTAKWLLD